MHDLIFSQKRPRSGTLNVRTVDAAHTVRRVSIPPNRHIDPYGTQFCDADVPFMRRRSVARVMATGMGSDARGLEGMTIGRGAGERVPPFDRPAAAIAQVGRS